MNEEPKTATPAHFWVVIDGDVRSGYFARFSSHYPMVRWFTCPRREDAYCFATEADARRVANYFVAHGRRARVVTLRPKPRPHRPVASVNEPPHHIRRWVERILAEGEHDADRADELTRITSGYRTLAQRYHPDKGGSSQDMQALNEAVQWLRNHSSDWVPF